MNLHALFTAALEASWQGSLAIVAILVVRPLLGARIPAGWRSLLWLLAMVRLLAPASILPASRTSLQNFANGEQAVQRVRLVRKPQPASEAPSSYQTKSVSFSPASAARVDWWKVAAQVWLAGVALSGMWLVGGALSLRRRLWRESTAVDPRVAQLWTACCKSVSVRRPPRLLATDAVTSPALVGVFRPLLLMPRSRQGKLSRADCEHIFLHELAHYRRGDHRYHLLQLCVRCVHWFNPVVWLGFRYLRADRELAADEWALRHLAPERGAAYGETLLRLLPVQGAPAFPRGAIGILEDGTLLRQRLRHVVTFRPRGRAGALAGGALVAGMAAILLTAAESPGGALRGWSVTRISIPKDGEIREAFAELKSPAGRVVTVTSGVTTQEGVTLEKLEWAGSPIRAVVTLRKGTESTELSAEAGLVSKNDELTRAPAQVEIESKFIEIPDALVRELKLSGEKSIADMIPAPPLSPGPALAGVLNEKDAEGLLRKLTATKGVDLLSAPRVTTLSQQRAVVEIIREFRYPTKYEGKAGQPVTPAAFETRKCGVTLEAEPAVREGGIIDLKAAPQTVEFLGFISYPSGKTIPVQREPDRKLIDLLDAPKLPEKPYAPGEIRQPVFSTRRTSSEVSVYSGQTIVLLIPAAAKTKGFESASAGKQLLVLVRATLVQPMGKAPASTPESARPPATNPAPGTSEIPVGTPVEGKPGFVTSPHSPKAGYIDVRGFPAGAEVNDPYSGRKFRLP